MGEQLNRYVKFWRDAYKLDENPWDIISEIDGEWPGGLKEKRVWGAWWSKNQLKKTTHCLKMVVNGEENARKS